VKLQGPAGERVLPLAEFFLAPGRTAIRPDEVLTEVAIPCRDGRSAYLKLGRRKGFTVSIVAAAAFGVLADGRVEDIRLALCAVAPTPIRSAAAEAVLLGEAPSAEAIERAAQLVGQDVQRAADLRQPPPDGYRRATPAYRVAMSYRMAKRLLSGICNGEGARQ
jgi:CO/xanthine dehydrogenase FAD-binding subunit